VSCNGGVLAANVKQPLCDKSRRRSNARMYAKPKQSALTRPIYRWQATRMDMQEFRDSVASGQPPKSLNFALTGLWWDAKGDWTRAHDSAQQDQGQAGAWVHAYLHRKEGDSSNAAYWYQRAGKPPQRGSLQEEWLSIAESLLG
jgi:hypothetical protein